MSNRIIVSGIYRSGTSLSAELIHQWGAYAGRQEDIFEDRYGYMEHFALQRLNDELLKNDTRVPPPPEQLAERAQDPALRERALQILDAMDRESAQNRAAAWVWKDPRLPLVLPFWSDIWGDVIYVIPVRHPIETVFSTANMDGVPAEAVPLSAGLVYWQFCMLNVLVYTERSRRKIFIAYDQLLQRPRAECTRFCHFLDEQCKLPSEGVDRRIETMAQKIRASQQHYHYPGSLSDMAISTREQRALFNFLRVKTIYPEESFSRDDFAPYPGWQEYLQVTEMLVTLTKNENHQENSS